MQSLNFFAFIVKNYAKPEFFCFYSEKIMQSLNFSLYKKLFTSKGLFIKVGAALLKILFIQG